MSNVLQLKQESPPLIAQLDDVTDTVRILWLESPRNSKECRHWMRRLDQLLDQRLHLMAIRDQV